MMQGVTDYHLVLQYSMRLLLRLLESNGPVAFLQLGRSDAAHPSSKVCDVAGWPHVLVVQDVSVVVDDGDSGERIVVILDADHFTVQRDVGRLTLERAQRRVEHFGGNGRNAVAVSVGDGHCLWPALLPHDSRVGFLLSLQALLHLLHLLPGLHPLLLLELLVTFPLAMVGWITTGEDGIHDFESHVDFTLTGL